MKRNPDIEKHSKRSKKQLLHASDYLQGITTGNRVLLGQALTLLESDHPVHRQLAVEIIEGSLKKSGGSKRIGITGTPGVGKSTFIEALGKQLIGQGHKVAVLAVDPSSQRTKGSILGDKTRMPFLANSPSAFVRPSPAGNTLGGVAAHTQESIILCEAVGFDIIFVETVGVGQSETAVYGMVDIFLLLLQPASGDELQGIKRGIVEMADLIAINKADGNLVDAAEKTRTEYKHALHLFPPKENGWTPQALTCSAIENSGLDELWYKCLDFFAQSEASGWLFENRKRQLLSWLHNELTNALQRHFFQDTELKNRLATVETAVSNGELTVPKAIEKLLANIL